MTVARAAGAFPLPLFCVGRVARVAWHLGGGSGGGGVADHGLTSEVQAVATVAQAVTVITKWRARNKRLNTQ